MGTGPGDKPLSWGLMASSPWHSWREWGEGSQARSPLCVLSGDRAQVHRERSVNVSCQEQPPQQCQEPSDDPPEPGPAPSHWSPPSLGSTPQVLRGLGRRLPHGTGRGQEQPSVSQANRGRGRPWRVWTPAEGVREVGHLPGSLAQTGLPRSRDRPPRPFLRFPFAPCQAGPVLSLACMPLRTFWEAVTSAPCSSGQS